MTQNRFSTEMFAESAAQRGFLFVPVAFAAAETPQVTPLQWMYQKMYEQALQANQKPKTRDLFAVMN